MSLNESLAVLNGEFEKRRIHIRWLGIHEDIANRELNIIEDRIKSPNDDANILALPARFITKEDAVKMIDVFFKTKFEGGRHLNRINKIPLEVKC